MICPLDQIQSQGGVFRVVDYTPLFLDREGKQSISGWRIIYG
jgi:hypothetical protein